MSPVAKPRYIARRVGATATPAQALALASRIRPFFVGPTGGGGGGGGAYTHTQSVASASWTVNHNLGYRPAISALSVGGVVMLADIVHTSTNQAVISFDQPVAGLAVCS